MAVVSFHWPTDTQRHTIIGKTGSGKTQFGLWSLSRRSYTQKPWIIFDFKRDPMIDEIPGTNEIGIKDKMPKKHGLYIVRPHPHEQEEVDAFLWRAWEREHVGLYLDEGYMIDAKSPALQAVLTQGRSKHVPVVMLTQRPAWITRFAYSEADYFSLFFLSDDRDRKTVKGFIPVPVEDVTLPQYYSWWYDNTRNYKTILQPVPDKDSILSTFHSRLIKPRRSF